MALTQALSGKLLQIQSKEVKKIYNSTYNTNSNYKVHDFVGFSVEHMSKCCAILANT